MDLYEYDYENSHTVRFVLETDLHHVYLDPGLEYWSQNVTPLGMSLWIMVSLMPQSKEDMSPSQSCRKSSEHAMKRLSIRVQVSLSSVRTVGDYQFIPAAWIRAARWSACASAPPSCPCSSDSLSSAAECLPVSDTLKTHPLGSAQTKKVNVTLFNTQKVKMYTDQPQH